MISSKIHAITLYIMSGVLFIIHFLLDNATFYLIIWVFYVVLLLILSIFYIFVIV